MSFASAYIISKTCDQIDGHLLARFLKVNCYKGEWVTFTFIWSNLKVLVCISTVCNLAVNYMPTLFISHGVTFNHNFTQSV